MEENMVTPYEYIRMVIEKYGDEADLNKYDNLIGDYKQLLELVKRLQKENENLKEYIFAAPNLDEMTAIKYKSIQEEAYIRGIAEEQQKVKQIIYENYIPKKVIRDKLEKLKENISTAQGEELLIFDSKLDVLKELLNKGE